MARASYQNLSSITFGSKDAMSAKPKIVKKKSTVSKKTVHQPPIPTSSFSPSKPVRPVLRLKYA